MKTLERLKMIAGVDDNPDKEGIDLFAAMIINECMDVVRKHTLQSTGISETYEGKIITCEIIKEYFNN